MKTKILELLKKSLPSQTNIIVQNRTTFDNMPYLKIMFSASDKKSTEYHNNIHKLFL